MELTLQVACSSPDTDLELGRHVAMQTFDLKVAEQWDILHKAHGLVQATSIVAEQFVRRTDDTMLILGQRESKGPVDHFCSGYASIIPEGLPQSLVFGAFDRLQADQTYFYGFD